VFTFEIGSLLSGCAQLSGVPIGSTPQNIRSADLCRPGWES